MLSGEGNAGERWKTTIGLISKKTFLHVQHTFLHTSLPLFCTTTTWKFQKLPSYTFYGGNVVRVRVHFFSLPLIFTLHCWPLAFLIFVNAATTFSCCSSNKKCLLCFFISRSRSLSSFSCWASLACRLLSLFLCLSLALYSKFVDMTINLSLIL